MRFLPYLLIIFSLSVSGQSLLPVPSTPTTDNINSALGGAIAASGTNTYTASLTGIKTYTGFAADIQFTNANTSTTTSINISSLGAVALKKYAGGSLVDLAIGDIQTGSRIRFYYNGTYLVMMGGNTSPGGADKNVQFNDSGTLNGTTDFQFIKSTKQIVGGGGSTAPAGSQTITWGDTNINSGSFGSALFGEISEIASGVGSALSVGEGNYINGYGGITFGRGTKASGSESFAGGAYYQPGFPGKTNTKAPQANGWTSFGWYFTDNNQIGGHGVNADHSAVLGGTNPNIPSGATNSVIAGGNRMKLSASDTSLLYAPNFRNRSAVGSGDRMVIAHANGTYDTQAIPSGGGGGWAVTGNTTVTTPHIIGTPKFDNIVFDSATSVARIQLKTKQSSAYGDYWWTVRDNNFGDPEHDQVLNWGFNTNGSGGRVNTSNAAAWFSMESHFNGVTDDDFEIHMPEVLSRDGSTNVRVLSMNIAKDLSNSESFWHIKNQEWRQLKSDSAYFRIENGIAQIINTKVSQTTLLYSNNSFDTQCYIDASGNYNVQSVSEPDDTGRIKISGFNESATISGSNTNAYRLNINNSKSSSTVWSGLSFQLAGTDKVYIGSAGASYVNPSLANSFFIYNNAGNATNFLASSSYNFDNNVSISALSGIGNRMVKANSSGVLGIATSGTDYQAPLSNGNATSYSATKVDMGGTQTADINIDDNVGGTHSFYIGNNTPINNFGFFGNGQGTISSISDLNITSSSGALNFGSQSCSFNFDGNLTSGNNVFIDASTTKKGLKYGGDYYAAGGLTDQSMIDLATFNRRAYKRVAKAATTANITLSGTQTVDGISLTAGNICLVKNQTTASQNGLYTVSSSTWTRTDDFDGTTDFNQGAIFSVLSGTTNANSNWICTNTGSITFGTTAITIAAYSGITTVPSNGQIPIGNGTKYTAATLTAGTGISVTNGSGTITVANTKVYYNGSASQTGTATTTFTVTIGTTQANTTYNVQVTPTSSLSAALFYVNNKTTTTFDVVYLAGLTGTVTFDWVVTP